MPTHPPFIKPADFTRAEEQALEELKTALARAWAAPDSAYVPLTAQEVIRRCQARDRQENRARL